jgi:type IV pilus assembly protein PilQ
MLVKEDIKGAVTMDIKDVPWNNAFKSILTLYNLNYIWEGDIIRIVNKESMDSELGLMAAMDKHRAQIEHSREVGVLHAAVIQIDYAGEDIENLSKSIIELLTKDDKGKPIGTISINKHNNALIINALDDDMLKIAKLIESIDKPIPQILIKANIIESTSDTARELGFQWGGMHKAGENTFIGPGGLTKAGLNATTGRLEYNPANATTTLIDHGYGLNHPSATGETSKTALGLITGVPGISLLEMQLTALQKDNKLNIIASPSLTTLDNHKSFTESGVKVPFVTVDEKGNRFVKFEDSVLRLEITPHVIDNRNILLKIIVKKDEVDTSRAVEGNPFIIKKMSETSLIVEDGETIVISGLNKHTNLQSNKGTPFLKDIPIIGKLFSANSNGNTMEEVLIFITPHILPPQKAQTAKKE